MSTQESNEERPTPGPLPRSCGISGERLGTPAPPLEMSLEEIEREGSLMDLERPDRFEE